MRGSPRRKAVGGSGEAVRPGVGKLGGGTRGRQNAVKPHFLWNPMGKPRLL